MRNSWMNPASSMTTGRRRKAWPSTTRLCRKPRLQKAHDAVGILKRGDVRRREAQLEMILQQEHELDVFERIPGGIGGARHVFRISHRPAQNQRQQAVDLRPDIYTYWLCHTHETGRGAVRS